ncbi:MAG TPA: sigma-54 dependent transcriptional regulator [Steroidobacteraceae bacterium]
MNKKEHAGRAIALVTAATDREVAAFRDVCELDSLRIVTQTEGDPHISVLLIGAGMAPLAGHQVRQAGTVPVTLLISYDASVLHRRELLEHCENILVAPFDSERLSQTLRTLCDESELDVGTYENIVGRSPQLHELLRVVSILARYDAPVLIKGETGTGKELVARGIHYSSARRDQPFVPVNCGALNDELLLAELFGYEKGAFTDAKRAHRGLVEQAAGGVLFLDEVDSLTPRGQAALLRFLQEQEYRPIGGTSVLKSDVRVITATNKDLEKLVSQACFREDLYYRIHLLDVVVPPLRTRAGDIDALAEHFLAQFSSRHGTPLKHLHPLTRQWMLEYEWPGNIRELQNYLYRVFVLSRGPTILVPHVKGDPISMHSDGVGSRSPTGEESGVSPGPALQSLSCEKGRVLKQFEYNYLHKVMLAAKGNISLAARRAGKERHAFRRLLKKHGLDRQGFIG